MRTCTVACIARTYSPPEAFTCSAQKRNPASCACDGPANGPVLAKRVPTVSSRRPWAAALPGPEPQPAMTSIADAASSPGAHLMPRR